MRANFSLVGRDKVKKYEKWRNNWLLSSKGLCCKEGQERIRLKNIMHKFMFTNILERHLPSILGTIIHIKFHFKQKEERKENSIQVF
jgi:hypothetical protein